VFQSPDGDSVVSHGKFVGYHSPKAKAFQSPDGDSVVSHAPTNLAGKFVGYHVSVP